MMEIRFHFFQMSHIYLHFFMWENRTWILDYRIIIEDITRESFHK